MRALVLGLLLGGSCFAQGPSRGPIAAKHKFPTRGPRPGTMLVQRAFPGLSFQKPVFVTHAGDASKRLFLLEQAGRILVFPNVDSTRSFKVFLDLRQKTRSVGSEEGLLGLAFDPSYKTNGYFYVHYSASNPTRSVIARFMVSKSDADKADPGSEVKILEQRQPYGNHNGGMLAFGPDGMLYLSFGDGGYRDDPGNNSQNLTTLLGAILRIDVRNASLTRPYVVPKDNPHASKGGGVRGEIWAHGLRNPWRFSFDRKTGALWCADVGQNSKEEVDLVRRGGNYGWRVYEGTNSYINPKKLPPSQFDLPIVEYGRTQARSLIGGYVYRGTKHVNLRGAYLHGDYATGRIWALVEKNGKLVSNTQVASFTSPGRLSSFGEDENGELLLVSHLGSLWRLAPKSTSAKFPLKLSQTGLFSSVPALSPAAGVYPYELQLPLWSDHAIKARWLAYSGTPIVFDKTAAWGFGKGTVLVKHFAMQMKIGVPGAIRNLETRVLVHEDDGWAGYVYRWNAQQTDADLLGADGAQESLRIQDSRGATVRRQTWSYPSRSDCMDCHTSVSGRVLGPRTRQFNRDVRAGSQVFPQLDLWNGLGFFSKSIGKASQYEAYPSLLDAKASVASRARAYLAANCAMCHQPGGGTPANIDLRYGISESQMNCFGVKPGLGSLGLPGAELIKRNERERSVLFERMKRLDSTRMPEIGSSVVDAVGTSILAEWIGTPFRSFGASCSGSAHSPALSAANGSVPRLGTKFQIRATGLPLGQPVVLFFGASKTRFGPFRLPLPLTAMGMTGCSLYVSADSLFPMANQSGTAALTLPIPNRATLLGGRFYLQSFVMAPKVNLFGAIVTNAAECCIVR